MRVTIPLGSIRGVRIGVHWSVLGIVVLLVTGLSARLLPAAVPGHTTAAYVATALVISVLFLGSLLAHETSHALVAMREGLRVEGITLWLLGGVAQLRGEAKSPRADAWIAAVGPLVSLALGGMFYVLTTLLQLGGVGRLIVGAAGYLALINVVLAVFNMIPAAPLDGGRVLRAIVWAWRGDRQQAAV